MPDYRCACGLWRRQRNKIICNRSTLTLHIGLFELVIAELAAGRSDNNHLINYFNVLGTFQVDWFSIASASPKGPAQVRHMTHALLHTLLSLAHAEHRSTEIKASK